MKSPWRLATSLAPEAFAQVRLAAIFECFKWDPQVEDTSVLWPAPLLLEAATWQFLSAAATDLSRELMQAEEEILARPDLHGELGLPRRLRRWLRCGRASAGCARVMRFDFHHTSDGWRISEVNSDVPGGFIESSGFTRLMAAHYPDARLAGDPAASYAQAIAAAATAGATAALVHSTAYTDDRQVMLYLERHLRDRGLRSVLVGPDQLRWTDGRASAATDWHNGPVDVIVRFYPAEWLANLSRPRQWRHYLVDGLTPMSNPAYALLSQSKRFALLWPRLRSPLTTWKRFLPATHDPRQVDWPNREEWVVKPALGRVGEDVGIAGVTEPRAYDRIARWVRRHPDHWVAQQRFQMLPVAGACEPLYACVGVFTIDGRVAGAYGRMSRSVLINHGAWDVAVFVDAHRGQPSGADGADNQPTVRELQEAAP